MTESARAVILATVYRELAEMEEANEAGQLTPRTARRKSGASVVFSLRLDPAELAALEARARVSGIKASVLARNLIRTGLAAAHGDKLAAAVDQLESVVSELRSAVI